MITHNTCVGTQNFFEENFATAVDQNMYIKQIKFQMPFACTHLFLIYQAKAFNLYQKDIAECFR